MTKEAKKWKNSKYDVQKEYKLKRFLIAKEFYTFLANVFVRKIDQIGRDSREMRLIVLSNRLPKMVAEEIDPLQLERGVVGLVSGLPANISSLPDRLLPQYSRLFRIHRADDGIFAMMKGVRPGP